MLSLPRLALAAVLSMTLVLAAAPAQASAPQPGTPEYIARDVTNVANTFGRNVGQISNPAYLPALMKEIGVVSTTQLLAQLATPTRPALTAAMIVPGWNVGNPLRAGWNGKRGVITAVQFTNRYGALLRGKVYSPKPGAKDPYTGALLKGPFPGVVLTPGSIQGSGGMYTWLAEDLAERGYVVLSYDVQGQGTSETFPHQSDGALPFCNPLSTPDDTEMTGCPGFPFQQSANFVKGTEDATDFFFSTPTSTYKNVGSAGSNVDAFNPLWKQFDRSVDPQTATEGRTTRFAIIGHSLGAAAVSEVQGTDTRVAAVVALDKLQSGGTTKPAVPALGIQSEYGLLAGPAALSGSAVLLPVPGDIVPQRERASGFDTWRSKNIDSMVIVPQASTHLEYADIPLVMPASRYGQALSSVYVQRWLGRYLKHEGVQANPTGTDPLLATTFTYLEPSGFGVWKPITLKLDGALSFYYCSAYAITDRNGTTKRFNGDMSKVGGCTG